MGGTYTWWRCTTQKHATSGETTYDQTTGNYTLFSCQMDLGWVDRGSSFDEHGMRLTDWYAKASRRDRGRNERVSQTLVARARDQMAACLNIASGAQGLRKTWPIIHEILSLGEALAMAKHTA